MNKLLLFILSLSLQGVAQEFFPTNFSGSISPPTTTWTSCSNIPTTLPTTTTQAITFNVSGIGVLNSTTKALYRINIDFSSAFGCGSYGSDAPNQDDDLQLLLIAPNSAACAEIYNADWAGAGGNTYSALSASATIGLSSVGCNLQSPNGKVIAGQTFNNTSNSNYGVYASIDNIITKFDGINANGVWTILVKNTSTYRPFCIKNVRTSLLFGDVTLIDEKASGDDCVNAVEWGGKPTCLSTTGKHGDANLPGYQAPSGYSNFNGTTCSWNADNNNSTWVKFTPLTTDPICLTLSGITTGQAQQSVIVKDSNNDGDNNPCTGTNGTYWNIVSCPNGPIYAGTSGGVKNQTHCFTPDPGQTYYLVVDGAAGAQSDVFLSGTNPPTITLPIELINFNVTCSNQSPKLNWQTASETDNQYFKIWRSTNGVAFDSVGFVPASGNSSQLVNYQWADSQINTTDNAGNLIDYYYKLSQQDYSGNETFFGIKYLDQPCEIKVFPNPIFNEGTLVFQTNHLSLVNVQLYNALGQLTREFIINNTFEMGQQRVNLDFTGISSGIYYLNLKINEKTTVLKVAVQK